MFFSKRYRSLASASTVRNIGPILDAAEQQRANSETLIPQKSNFRRRVLNAAGWSMLGYALTQVLRIVSNLILTRLLVPEMFGVMAVATLVQVAVTMLSDLGLRPAAIQSAIGESQTYLDTAWTLQAIHGCFVWLVCVLIAFAMEGARLAEWFPASSVYAAPELPWIIISTSFAMVIMGLQSTKVILAYRRIDLSRLTSIEIVNQLVSLVVAVVLAFYTQSIWAFVISTLVSSAVFTILSHTYLQGGTNRFQLDREAAYDLVRFGRWVMLSSIFSVLAANGDRLLLASWVSPVTLGIYVLAFSLIAMFDGAGNRLFAAVAMPALSKTFNEDPDRLKDTYFKFRLVFDAIFVAAAGAIYASGRTIIETLYDARYADATHIIEVFSFSLLISRYTIVSSVFLATGEPQNLSLLNLTRTVSMFSIVPLAYYFFGFEGAVWAISLHALPTVLIIFFLNARHNLNNPIFELLIGFAWPLGYGAATIATEIIHQF